MSTPRHYLGAALLALALLMAVWDGGAQSGKLVVAAVAFVAGLIQLDVISERDDRQ